MTGATALVLSVAATAGVMPAHKPRFSDHNRARACRACHVSEPVTLGQSGLAECRDCHSEGVRLPENTRVASAVSAAPADDEPEPTRNEAGPGMNVTMYYDDSRLGDAPNEMVLIPGGEFTMGTNTRLSDEGPEHKVTLPAFQIDRYEVTNLQYKKFVDATQHRSPQHWTNRTFPRGKADHPVVFVSWDDAHDYCAWAGKRLPTDQEWEKAARGTDARNFPYGNEFDMYKSNNPVRWRELHQQGDTTPVGAFADGRSPYGLFDMSGNVWEWTDSWYLPYPGNTRINENYGETYKTLKGGSWWDCSFYQCGISAPSYNRAFFLRGTRNKSFGFRCAKDAH